ncbi:MAG: flagellar biosynthesis protein FlhB [Halioglobus sp.]
MAEENSAQERTEQPTPKRLLDAKKKGQVLRSRELNTMLSLLFGAIGLLVFGGSMASEFVGLFQASLSFDREVAFDSGMIAVRLVHLIVACVIVLIPIFIVLFAGAMVGPMIMGGWTFSAEAMAFKVEKLSPLKGLQRIFSAKGLVELLKALFKFLFLSLTTIFLFNLLLDNILMLGDEAPHTAFVDALDILRWSFVVLSMAMIFIVIFDVPFEIWNHNRQLKMTRQEVLDEMKESDGRPEVKSRIRNLQREISQRRMMEELPTADVVITNPTHYAVALKYEGLPGEAPKVIAKGRDLIAMHIRNVATAHDIPFYEAPPLARAIYATTEIGDEIPENLYLAVAKVLAYVFQLRSAGYAEPPSDDDIAVPDSYQDLPINRGLNDDE